jgi:serine/threonine-protein kinase
MTPCQRCGDTGHDSAACPLGHAAEPPPLAPGVVVGNSYQIESELGRGAMGVVYRAHDVWLDRTVALKVIAPTWASSADAEPLLRKEAQALASIRNGHVVQVYAFGHHAGSYFFAMEYVHGDSLANILWAYREHGSFIPLRRALTILERIAMGIGAVHEGGLVHRDVKPGNILIEEDTGRPVLVDFGLASHDERMRATTFSGGTPRYMPAEQAGMGVNGAVVGPWSDVYAFGATAFEILGGRAPFEEDGFQKLIWAHMLTPPPPLSKFRPDLAPFDPIVARALAKDPKDRYERAIDMVNALLAAADESAKDDTAPPQKPRFTSIPPDGAPLRVLTVDDDPAFRKFAVKATELACRDKPFKVSAAGTGAEAIEIARHEPPDVVLLDFDMPGLDGVDTLSHLRSLSEGGRARVVVLSGRLGAQDRWRFSVLGVKDFVAKPIDLRRLVRVIEELVSRVQSSMNESPTQPRD